MMKNIEYLKYLLIHKYYVFIESCRLGIPLRGLLHDLDKFLPWNWIPYKNKFYTDSYSEYEFDKAWLRHQNSNKHHWQYWVLHKDNGEVKPLFIPLKYRKEMLADWRGASLAKGEGRGIKEWYEENKERMILHDSVKLWLNKKILEGNDEN